MKSSILILFHSISNTLAEHLHYMATPPQLGDASGDATEMERPLVVASSLAVRNSALRVVILALPLALSE